MELTSSLLDIMFGSIYVVIGLTAIICNAVNLFNFFKCKKLKTINNMLIMTLGFNDFWCGVCIVCFSAFQFDPNFGPSLDAIQCKLAYILIVIFLLSSIFLVPLIGINRAVYVCYNKV